MDETSRVGLAVMDSTHPFADYGLSDYDATHNFNFSAIYQLPFKGNRLVDGWRLGGVLTLQSGNPLNIVSGNPTTGTAITGFTGLGGIRPDITGLPSVGKSIITTGSQAGNVQWFAPASTLVCDPTKPSSCTSASLITLPVQVVGGRNVFHFGNLSRNALRGPGFSNVDFSLTKTTKITERFSHELRIEAFDILNHPNFANPGLTAQVGSSSFGVISATRGPTGDAGSSRQIQFAMKVIF